MPDKNGVFVVFYAWQSDHPSNGNKILLREAADLAARNISLSVENSFTVRIDQDTESIPGLCDIPAVILSKIDSADAFLCDLTYVAETVAEKPKKSRYCSNPNVLFELGYAFKSLGPERIICVLNEKFGPASEQIFDLDHRRHPISYLYPNSKKKRKEIIESLSKDLETAILLILQSSHNQLTSLSLSISLSLKNGLATENKPHEFCLDCNHIEDACDLPDYQERVSGNPLFPYSNTSFSSFDRVNSEFYRQKMKRIIQLDSTVDFEFKIKNTNSRALTDIKVYFDFPKQYKHQNTCFRSFRYEDIQEPPYRSGIDSMMQGFKFTRQESESVTEIFDLPDVFRLVFHFGKLQAQEEKSSPTIRLGATVQGTIPAQAQIFADEFPSPQQVDCLFHCSYIEKIISLQDLESDYFVHES